MPRIYSINLGGGGGGGLTQVISVATAGDLPDPPGDYLIGIVDDTDSLYFWNGSQWILVGSSSTLIGRADQVAITNGSQSVSVVFSSPMADTNYSVVSSIGNTTDPDPIYLIPVRTTKLTTG